MTREAIDARALLLRSSRLSSAFIDNIERFLQEALTASTSVHGVLIDVIGVGVLILGKSGIGKSELALDLVTRGHRLVAPADAALAEDEHAHPDRSEEHTSELQS